MTKPLVEIYDAQTGQTVSREMTDAEYADWQSGLGQSARVQRNALLAASDWTQLVDAPVDSFAWATYRQELRDVPNQPGFPATIVWPTQPVG
jgi:hypothetical protein